VLNRKSVLHQVAVKLSDVLPEKIPNYKAMADHDFISLLAWLEDWDPERVYKTAYKESYIDYIQTWDEWTVDMRPLPLVVRTELERAMKIHDTAGNLKAIRAYSFFFNNIGRIFMYGGLGLIMAWILF